MEVVVCADARGGRLITEHGSFGNSGESFSRTNCAALSKIGRGPIQQRLSRSANIRYFIKQAHPSRRRRRVGRVLFAIGRVCKIVYQQRASQRQSLRPVGVDVEGVLARYRQVNLPTPTEGLIIPRPGQSPERPKGAPKGNRPVDQCCRWSAGEVRVGKVFKLQPAILL